MRKLAHIRPTKSMAHQLGNQHQTTDLHFRTLQISNNYNHIKSSLPIKTKLTKSLRTPIHFR